MSKNNRSPPSYYKTSKKIKLSSVATADWEAIKNSTYCYFSIRIFRKCHLSILSRFVKNFHSNGITPLLIALHFSFIIVVFEEQENCFLAADCSRKDLETINTLFPTLSLRMINNYSNNKSEHPRMELKIVFLFSHFTTSCAALNEERNVFAIHYSRIKCSTSEIHFCSLFSLFVCHKYHKKEIHPLR